MCLPTLQDELFSTAICKKFSRSNGSRKHNMYGVNKELIISSSTFTAWHLDLGMAPTLHFYFYVKRGDLKQYPCIAHSSEVWSKHSWILYWGRGEREKSHKAEIKMFTKLGSYREVLGKDLLPTLFQLLAEFNALQL